MTSANSRNPGNEARLDGLLDSISLSSSPVPAAVPSRVENAVEGSIAGLQLPPEFSTARFLDPAFLAGIANDILKEGRAFFQMEEPVASPSGSVQDATCIARDMANRTADALGVSNPVPFSSSSARMMDFQDPALFEGLADHFLPPTSSALSRGMDDPGFYFLPPQPTTPETGLGNRPDAGSSRTFAVESIRQDFPILHQRVHGHPLVWLDNAATTQKPRAVIDAIARFYERDNSNIHRAAHTLAARATDHYEGARDRVRRFIKASQVEEIVFVHGATEAINLVSQTFGRKFLKAGDEILLSEIEHHANIVPWQHLAQENGVILKVIPINDRGELLLEEFERLLGPQTRLVAVTQVSNSLGTVVPVQTITQLAHRHGARVLIDGSQSIPHLPIDVQAIGCDFFVFSGHKLFAPTGIGVLYARREILDSMPPWQGGGNMIDQVTFEHTTYQAAPAKFEAGTGILAGAVGLAAAMDYLDALGMETIHRYEQQLLAHGTEVLSRIPGLRLIGTAPEKASVLSFVMPGISSEDLGRYLDRQGIAVRAGHHCAQPSLRHFGLTSTVRPSVAFYNTFAELDRLASALSQARNSLL